MSNILKTLAAGSVSGEYQISRSLRFNSADSAYLSRTPASAGDRKTWTWSGWVKLGAIGGSRQLFSGGAGVSDQIFISDPPKLFVYLDGANRIESTPLYRDPSAWYHIVIAVDTTQATPSNRTKLYVNGVQVTDFTGTAITQNNDTKINDAVSHTIGRYAASASEYFSGYLAEINFIDGGTPSTAVDADGSITGTPGATYLLDFGEFSETTGVWTPKRFSGPWNVGTGVNGFYLPFSDNSDVTATTLGKDDSGNGNNWTPSGSPGFSVTAGVGNDSLVDTPTQYGTDTGAGGEVRGNYCTYNPIGLGGGTLSNGNLTLVVASGTTPAVGTFAMTTGKWYWEVTLTTSSGPRVGVFDVGSSNPAGLGETAFGWAIINSPSRTFHNNSTTSYGTFDGNNGDVVMLAYDADAGKLWYGVNGSFFASGNPATGANPSQSSVTGNAIVPANGFGGGSSNTHNANFGQRPFAYTAPSGFKALVTTNLPEPTVVQGNDYFNTVLYTGNGTTNHAITGFGFQPDWVWQKSRNQVNNNHLTDAVRGVNKDLLTNATTAEVTYTDGVTSFDSDGFTVGNQSSEMNASGITYAVWGWKADGAGVSNTAGTIPGTVTVSANTTAGISIVTYTGTGSATTVGHGLGAVPKMVIVKERGATRSWIVYHAGISTSPAANEFFLTLNTTDARQQYSGMWNNTTPTSTVFTIGADGAVSTNTGTYVAYCFAEVEGFSKFGSFVGNGSADGPFIYTGFRPAWVMVKGSGQVSNWQMLDIARNPFNAAQNFLRANSSNAETSLYPVDINSNGFKIRTTDSDYNTNVQNYIFMAFAENPFKNSLAR